MKALGTGMVVAAGTVAGMVAGACLVMNVPTARKIYRCTKRTAKQLMGL